MITIVRILSLWVNSVYTKFHDNLSNICQEFLVWTKVIKQQTILCFGLAQSGLLFTYFVIFQCICPVGLESQISDMAAVFTRRLKVTVSESFFG